MIQYQMGAAEARFADLIWKKEPVTAAELAKEADGLFGWKKTTTYTVLKRLCDKGIFRNDKGMVSSVITRGEFESRQSEQFVEENFNGSLPAFLAAFTAGKKLTREEVESLRRMVAEYKE